MEISHKIPPLLWLPTGQGFPPTFYVSKGEFLCVPMVSWCSREDVGINRRRTILFPLQVAFPW